MIVYTAGISTSVSRVLVSKPPITVTAIGARHSLPSPSFKAIGDIASTSAEVVIRIGRRRVGPAWSNASLRTNPRLRKVLV